MFDTYEGIFSERARSYQAAMLSWPNARRAEFELALQSLPMEPGKVLCDMPAGGGYLRAYLPSDVHYLAIEPTTDFFATCPEDEYADRIHSSLHSVPLPDAHADYIVSLAGLHHEPNLDDVMLEMRRLVRSDGWVVIVEVNEGSGNGDFLNGFVDAFNPMGHKGVFFDDDVSARLVAAGFDVVRNQVIDLPWSFDSTDDMGTFCRQLFGIERATPTQVVTALEQTLSYSEGPGKVNLNWPLRCIVSRPT